MKSSAGNVLVGVLALVVGAGLFYGGMYFGSSRYTPFGMMSGYGPGGMMGGAGGTVDGGNMMGGYGFGSSSNAEPITVQDARTAVESYLDVLGNGDLSIKEIMIFDNGAYAAIEEKSTGIGAFELLVDPIGLSVFPEFGPNMMWNLKYGMMSGSNGSGMMGGGGMMMRGWYGNNVQVPDVSSAMPVDPEEAAKTAQKYLDVYMPGARVSSEVTPFYGYYTMDLERDGNIIGMLSVNGFTKQVFFHSWHGTFIQMSEAE